MNARRFTAQYLPCLNERNSTLRDKRVTSVRSRRLRNVRYASNTDRIDASQRTAALCWEFAGSRLAGAVSLARDQFQPGRRMEGAHQHVHPDHSIQR